MTDRITEATAKRDRLRNAYDLSVKYKGRFQKKVLELYTKAESDLDLIEKEVRIQRSQGERREAEYLAQIILDAPKTKDARSKYFVLLSEEADRDTGQRAKGEVEFFDAMIRFVNK